MTMDIAIAGFIGKNAKTWTHTFVRPDFTIVRQAYRTDNGNQRR
jgi:hypothetical protein